MQPDEFSKLFRSTYSKLLVFAKKRSLSHSEAEDIVMTAFQKVWASKRIDSSMNPEAYLYRAVTNCILDLRRRESKRVASLPMFIVADEDNEKCMVSDLHTSNEPHTDLLVVMKSEIERALQKAKEYDERFALAFAARLSGVYIRQALQTPKGRISYTLYSKLFEKLRRELEREK